MRGKVEASLLYYHLRADRINLQERGEKPLPFMAKNAHSWFQEDSSWQKTTRHGKGDRSKNTGLRTEC
jgi:hypothetical protein